MFRWLRLSFNSLMFPLWTALCVSGALLIGWLTRDPLFFYRNQRGWAGGLFKLCGIELVVHGAENMAADGAYVIVANHASYFDIPALFASLPKLPQIMAKAELARIPFLGAALRAGRHILVKRGNHATAKSSLDNSAEQLKSGAAILIFPEGTRSTRDAIGRFKTGAFRLAKLGDVAILPVGISGTRYVLPKHGRFIRPHRVSVRIGRPLSAAEVRDTPLNELSERARARLSELAQLPLVNDAAPAAEPTEAAPTSTSTSTASATRDSA
ncbi:MAG TPA: lysophospholipid acyltransferase family protein [Polyangiaceae bacterium]|nr:lysophospholipid acyltransferase family protein [Polyangiaceae bacterium]